MTWCRIIDANGEQYLCVLAPSDQGPAILTSWCSGGRMMTAVLPPEEFTSHADAQEFLAAMRPENVLMLRRSTEEAMVAQAEVASHALASEVIAKAKGLH